MSSRKRFGILAAVGVLLATVAVAYTVQAANRAAPADVTAIDLAQPGQILFRDTASGRAAAVAISDPGGPRSVSAWACDRVYAAAATAVCLQPTAGLTPAFAAVVLDRYLAEVSRARHPGIPNRARVGSGGSHVAFTGFVTGHSYAKEGFSTRTSIVDIANNRTYGDIETLQIYHEGRKISTLDVNLWGVTFAADGKRFYASMSTGGKTYLVEADIATWEARTLRENAECPSLSPDGHHIVFKKRVSDDGARPWQLYVLDLRSRAEWALPSTLNVDDQAAWLDEKTVMYSLLREDGGTDIWASAVTGQSPPKLLIANASSPSVL